MTELETVWQRIETWYAANAPASALRPGASERAVAAAESELGLTFPAEFRASLLRHDGTAEGAWPTGTLLPVEGILSEAGIWRGLLEGGDFGEDADHDASEGGGLTQPGWWVRGWVPVDADGAGNGAVLDLDPGPRGQVGQLLDMDHEVGPSGPHHASFVAYLRHVADELDSGAYVFDDGDLTETETSEP